MPAAAQIPLRSSAACTARPGANLLPEPCADVRTLRERLAQAVERLHVPRRESDVRGALRRYGTSIATTARAGRRAGAGALGETTFSGMTLVLIQRHLRGEDYAVATLLVHPDRDRPLLLGAAQVAFLRLGSSRPHSARAAGVSPLRGTSRESCSRRLPRRTLLFGGGQGGGEG